MVSIGAAAGQSNFLLAGGSTTFIATTSTNPYGASTGTLFLNIGDTYYYGTAGGSSYSGFA